MPSVAVIPPPEAAVARVPMRRLEAGAARESEDALAVEAPLELRLGERATTVLMRTPGDDEELVRGFLFTEGIVARAEDVLALRRPLDVDPAARGNVLAADLDPARARLPEDRFLFASASCGICGKVSLASLSVTAPLVTSRLRVARAVLEALPARLREAQPTFAETGGLHAAALFDAAGELLAVREDVGRHNAVDKVVGWALAAGRVPLGDCGLHVSGRLGFEIVQKAVVAGVPLVAAVGAASSLAVDLALRHGLTLATFLRPGRMNLYGDPSRVTA